MRYWNWNIKLFWIKSRNKNLEISSQIILSLVILIRTWIICIIANFPDRNWLIHRPYIISGTNYPPNIIPTPIKFPLALNPTTNHWAQRNSSRHLNQNPSKSPITTKHHRAFNSVTSQATKTRPVPYPMALIKKPCQVSFNSKIKTKVRKFK